MTFRWPFVGGALRPVDPDFRGASAGRRLPAGVGDELGESFGVLFVRVTVAEVEPIAARVRRIRLTGPQLVSITCTPGQQLRVLVTDIFWLTDRESSAAPHRRDRRNTTRGRQFPVAGN